MEKAGNIKVKKVEIEVEKAGRIEVEKAERIEVRGDARIRSNDI